MLALLLALQTPQTVPAPAQAPAKAAPAPQPRKPPRFKVTPDTPQHFGSVGPTEKRSLSYVLTNQADVPMGFRISNNSPGTTMDDAALKTPLAPGESRTLTMHVDPTGFAGYQRRAVRLEPTLADEPYTFAFRVDMTIRPDLAVDAEKKTLGGVALHESPEAVFTFKRETGEPVELRLESDPSPYLDAEIEPQGPKAELRLTLRPGKLKKGQSSGLEILKVHTNAPLQPHFTLYLDWRLKLPVDLVPSRLVFDRKDDRFQSLELKSDKPFAVEAVDFDAQLLTLSGQTRGEGTTHRLTFYRRKDKAPDSTLRLRIKGVEETIEVPVLFRLP